MATGIYLRVLVVFFFTMGEQKIMWFDIILKFQSNVKIALLILGPRLVSQCSVWILSLPFLREE